MPGEIFKYRRSTEAAAKRVLELQAKLAAYQSGEIDDPEVQALRQENAKLKYRLQIIHQAISTEMEKAGGEDIFEPHLDPNTFKLSESSIEEILKHWCKIGISAAFPEIEDPPISLGVALRPEFGDYQLNSAMAICQLLGKIQRTVWKPRQVAEKIQANLPAIFLVEKIEVAGPGFINIFLNSREIAAWTCETYLKGVKPPKIEKKLRVVVDYSSPNIAKEMHVGHLRSTIIGDSIANLFDWLGHDVLRINHIGDWGTQFGMLIAHLQDSVPNFEEKMPSVSDLMSLYKQSKQRFDSDADFNKRAHECVVKLQSHDPKFMEIWGRICEKSRHEFQRIYSRLGIGNLQERGESWYQTRMKAIIDELERKGLVTVESTEDPKTKQTRVCKVIFVPNIETPMMLVKSDGGFTYDTSDLATIKQRLDEEKADWIIYVVDKGQSLHFQQLFAAARLAGWYDPAKKRIVHMEFGLVLGEGRKKLKTRSGETIRLVDLLDEGVARSEKKLLEKGRDKELTPEELQAAKESVAYGCIKYADLAKNRSSDYVFSFDQMLDDRGNTAAYLLYTYTRIRSIFRNSGVAEAELVAAANAGFEFQHEKEFRLAKKLLKFADVVLAVLADLHLHYLCDYLFELSSVYTEFYDNCYCLERDKESGAIRKVHLHRLILCELTAKVMAQCFSILGIKTLEKM